MNAHRFEPRGESGRACVRCPFPESHPCHATIGQPMEARGTMVLTRAATGSATLILPDGRALRGVLYDQ